MFVLCFLALRVDLFRSLLVGLDWWFGFGFEPLVVVDKWNTTPGHQSTGLQITQKADDVDPLKGRSAVGQMPPLKISHPQNRAERKDPWLHFPYEVDYINGIASPPLAHPAASGRGISENI